MLWHSHARRVTSGGAVARGRKKRGDEASDRCATTRRRTPTPAWSIESLHSQHTNAVICRGGAPGPRQLPHAAAGRSCCIGRKKIIVGRRHTEPLPCAVWASRRGPGSSVAFIVVSSSVLRADTRICAGSPVYSGYLMPEVSLPKLPVDATARAATHGLVRARLAGLLHMWIMSADTLCFALIDCGARCAT